MADPWVALSEPQPAADQACKSHTVDVSKWLGEGVEFVWLEPDIPKQFQTAEDAAAIKRIRPAWTNLLCQIVAQMGHMHQSPPAGDKPIIERYMAMVDHKDLFEHLLLEFKTTFPHLLGLTSEAVADEGNALSTVSPDS